MSGTECPYAECGSNATEVQNSGFTCDCAWRRPVETCTCGVANRPLARFCRGCRRQLTQANEQTRGTRAGAVSMINVPGRFRQPPSVAGGLIYAQRLDGTVLELSSRPRAEPREAGKLGLTRTGFNRGTVVDVKPYEHRDLRGWTYLTVAPEGVEALSLATGKNTVLYRAQANRPVFAAGGEDEVLKMRGMAANERFAAFAVRGGPESCTLVRLHLGVDRPAEALFSLNGTEVAGPVMQGEFTAFCTTRQAGLYGRLCGTRVADFPDWFHPYLAIGETDLNLPPGGVPLVVAAGEGSIPKLLVAGDANGRSGLLEAQWENEPAIRFRPLPRGSALNAGWNGSACLCSDGAIEVYVPGKTHRLDAAVAQWMPATATGSWVVWFADDSHGDLHKLEARGPQRLSLSFESSDCRWTTCFGALVASGDLLLGVLNPGAPRGRPELQFVRWPLGT